MGSSFCCREDRRQNIYCNPAMRLSMWSRAPTASGRDWATRNRLTSRKRYEERSPGSSKTRPTPSTLNSLITVLKTQPSPTCREFQRRLEHGLHGMRDCPVLRDAKIRRWGKLPITPFLGSSCTRLFHRLDRFPFADNPGVGVCWSRLGVSFSLYVIWWV
jgi:hypothetical protein